MNSMGRGIQVIIDKFGMSGLEQKSEERLYIMSLIFGN